MAVEPRKFLFTQLSMCAPGKRRARPLHGTPAKSSWGFLDQVDGGGKPQQEIHVILDNLSAHKTSKVQAFLEQYLNVHLHVTPTYSSRLNQVEIWFGRIEREVIARGVFTSLRDLARKLMRYIRAYSKAAHPFTWKHSDVRRRVPIC